MGMENREIHKKVYLNVRELTSVHLRRYNKGVLYVPLGFLRVLELNCLTFALRICATNVTFTSI